MRDEFNDITINNDVQITNEVSLKNDEPVAAAQSVIEIADSEQNTAGKLAKVTTNIITLAAVVTVAAAVVLSTVSAAPEVIEEEIVPVVPVAPVATVSDVGVSSFGYNSNLTVNFSIADDENEIESFSAWIEDSAGVISECTVENGENGSVAETTLTDGSDWESGLLFVLYAQTYEGWTGEIYRGLLTLPAASDIEVFYAGTEPMYSHEDGEGGVYIYLGCDYNETVSAYYCYFEDENGAKYECTIEDTDYANYVEDGFIYPVAYVDLPTDEIPAFDAFGRLDLVVEVLTVDGWLGEIYREKQQVSYDYLTVPWIQSVSVTSAEDGDVTYWYVDITIYDPDAIWTDLIVTITDANGKIYTVGLNDSDYVGIEYDDYETTYYYYISFTVSNDDQLELFSDGTLNVQMNAMWHVPQEDGTYSDYDTLVYDDYDTVG